MVACTTRNGSVLSDRLLPPATLCQQGQALSEFTQLTGMPKLSELYSVGSPVENKKESDGKDQNSCCHKGESPLSARHDLFNSAK